MKYAVFAIAFALGVPAFALAGAANRTARGLLLSALLFSTCLGDVANINFWSTEAYRGPDRGFEVMLTDLLCLSLSLVLVLRSPGRLAWLPYNTLWMGAFFILSCALAASADHAMLSAFTLFKLLRLYAVYWCVVNALRAGVSKRWVWAGIVAVALFVTLTALFQRYALGVVRVPGPFDHSNTMPSYLILIIPVLLMWGLCDRSLGTAAVVLSVVGAFGMVFAVVTTLSRAGLLLCAAAVLGTLCLSAARMRSRRTWLAGAAVLAGLCVGAAKSADTVMARFEGAPEASRIARDEFVTAAAKMTGENPGGVGINQFTLVLTETPLYRDHFEVLANEEQAGVVHHIYWLTAAETGYAGLFLFLFVVGRFTVRALWMGLRHRSADGMVLLAAATGMGGVLVNGFLEWTLRISPVSYLFMIVCGLTVALAERAGAAPRPPGRRAWAW